MTEPMDDKTLKRILRLQRYAARRGLPIMVFADREHMQEAVTNMETGAIMNKIIGEAPYLFIPDQRHRI